MQLLDVFKIKFTDDELLAHQRKIHKKRFDAYINEIEKDKAKPGYVEKCIKNAENAMKNGAVTFG